MASLQQDLEKAHGQISELNNQLEDKVSSQLRKFAKVKKYHLLSSDIINLLCTFGPYRKSGTTTYIKRNWGLKKH